MEKLGAIIESALFVSGEPLGIKELAAAFSLSEDEINKACDEINKQGDDGLRGTFIRRLNDKIQLCTKQEYASFIDKIFQVEKSKSLSQSIIETLSIIAYKQPITRIEIENIRGVRCEYSVGQLMSIGLIFEAGRKDTIGKPILYATTEKFLQMLNISSTEELPDREKLLFIDKVENLIV